MRNIYQDALDVQNACNLSGVLKSWASHVDAIWTEVRANPQSGTDAFNHHPVNVLFASKVASLTGSESTNGFHEAYEVCTQRAPKSAA